MSCTDLGLGAVFGCEQFDFLFKLLFAAFLATSTSEGFVCWSLGLRPVPDNVISCWILSCGCCSFNCWLSRGRVRFRHAGNLSPSDVGQLDGEDGDSGDAGVADDDVIGGDVKGTEKEALCSRDPDKGVRSRKILRRSKKPVHTGETQN